MRIVYMGSPNEAISPLLYLLEEGSHEVVAVVSQPARDVGRGRSKVLTDPPVAQFAKERGLKTVQPVRSRDAAFLDWLRDLRADLVVTCAYGQILTQEFLDIPQIGTINIHPSLLPEHRGATPVPAAILSGQTTTGVTIAFTVRALDAGPIICQEVVDILPGELAQPLLARLLKRGGPLLLTAIERLLDKTFVATPQSDGMRPLSHCKMIAKGDGLVDWNLTATVIVQRYRAFQPWPGIFSFLEGKQITLEELRVTSQPEGINTAEAGRLYYQRGPKELVVACGGGSFIVIDRLKRAGSRSQSGTEFWNGVRNKDESAFSNQGESS